MATVTKFEEVVTWQKARELSRLIFEETSKESLKKDFDLSRQMKRSAGSIMDNIAEGHERGGKGELIQFLSIAKGSCGELRSQVHRAFDYGHLTESSYQDLIHKCEEISKMIMGFIKYLNSVEIKGVKYKVQ